MHKELLEDYYCKIDKEIIIILREEVFLMEQ